MWAKQVRVGQTSRGTLPCCMQWSQLFFRLPTALSVQTIRSHPSAPGCFSSLQSSRSSSRLSKFSLGEDTSQGCQQTSGVPRTVSVCLFFVGQSDYRLL